MTGASTGGMYVTGCRRSLVAAAAAVAGDATDKVATSSAVIVIVRRRMRDPLKPWCGGWAQGEASAVSVSNLPVGWDADNGCLDAPRAPACAGALVRTASATAVTTGRGRP